MSDSLKTGDFYGRTERRLELRGVVLTEVAHAFGRKLPCHTHESAYFGLLLAGSYSERCSHRSADYDPFTIGFHPPALTHSDEIGRSGSRMFCVGGLVCNSSGRLDSVRGDSADALGSKLNAISSNIAFGIFQSRICH